jgi:hypothetical protein
MADTINVSDLPEQEVQFLERWVEHLRVKARVRREGEEPGWIEFSTWQLGVMGNLTREEIYDYL